MEWGPGRTIPGGPPRCGGVRWPGRKHRIGAQPGAVDDQRAELVCTGAVERAIRGHPDFGVRALVAEVAYHAACFEVDSAADERVPHEIEVCQRRLREEERGFELRSRPQHAAIAHPVAAPQVGAGCHQAAGTQDQRAFQHSPLFHPGTAVEGDIALDGERIAGQRCQQCLHDLPCLAGPFPGCQVSQVRQWGRRERLDIVCHPQCEGHGVGLWSALYLAK